MTKTASRLDLLLAMRAILYTDLLSPGEKAAGCAILSHYNEDTGECDPGAQRVAALVGVKRDTSSQRSASSARATPTIPPRRAGSACSSARPMAANRTATPTRSTGRVAVSSPSF
jgi:hypothetical protein